MKPLTALGGGLAGAAAVTIIHESVRRLVPQAPRMDLLEMNAISKGYHAAGRRAPQPQKLFAMALVGDLVSNALYYSLAGIGKDKNVYLRSSILGLAAGIGAVVLPGPLGLEERHSNRTLSTKLMTVGLYVAGSIVSAAIIKYLVRKSEERNARRKKEWECRLVTSAMS